MFCPSISTMVGNGIVKIKGARTALLRLATSTFPPFRLARYSKLAPVDSACSINSSLCSMIRPPKSAAPAKITTKRIVTLLDLLITFSDENTRAQRKARMITHARAVRNNVTDKAKTAKARRVRNLYCFSRMTKSPRSTAHVLSISIKDSFMVTAE